MKNEMKNIAKGLIIGVALMITATVLAAWSEPTQPPTGGNPEAPLNVGNVSQTKGGNLVVNANNQGVNGLLVPFGNVLIGTANFPANLKLNVGSGIGATLYCDQNGRNCFTAANLCQKVPNLCQ